MNLSDKQITQIRTSTKEWVNKASTIYGKNFSEIEVRFDLRGKTSGMFCYKNRHCYIRYNSKIFARYFDESLAHTVPHEVAHYVVFKHFSKRAKPHGEEWKSVMQHFGVPAEVTCKLDLSDLPQRRLKRFDYRCGCKSHQLTSIRHNRIIRGASNYACPKCHQPLVADFANNLT